MKIMKTNVQNLIGNWWYRGWALDFHTISSVQIPDGHFDTERSELGEALFLFKYRNDIDQIQPLADTVTYFLKSEENQWWFKYVDAFIPVPPSSINRPFQPVPELARAISIKLGIRIIKKSIPQEWGKSLFSLKIRTWTTMPLKWHIIATFRGLLTD